MLERETAFFFLFFEHVCGCVWIDLNKKYGYVAARGKYFVKGLIICPSPLSPPSSVCVCVCDVCRRERSWNMCVCLK